MTLVMFPLKKKKKKKKEEKRTKNMLTILTVLFLKKGENYAGIIYKGLHLKYKR